MKKIILTILISISINTYADQSFEMKYCTNVASLAATVMEYRQTSNLLAQDFFRMEGVLDDPITRKINTEIILNAYSQPLQPTLPTKVQSIKEYSNEIFLDCMRNFTTYYGSS